MILYCLFYLASVITAYSCGRSDGIRKGLKVYPKLIKIRQALMGRK